MPESSQRVDHRCGKATHRTPGRTIWYLIVGGTWNIEHSVLSHAYVWKEIREWVWLESAVKAGELLLILVDQLSVDYNTLQSTPLLTGVWILWPFCGLDRQHTLCRVWTSWWWQHPTGSKKCICKTSCSWCDSSNSHEADLLCQLPPSSNCRRWLTEDMALGCGIHLFVVEALYRRQMAVQPTTSQWPPSCPSMLMLSHYHTEEWVSPPWWFDYECHNYSYTHNKIMHTCTCAHTHTHNWCIYTCTCTCTRTHTIDVCTQKHTCTCTHTCMHACKHTYLLGSEGFFNSWGNPILSFRQVPQE